MRSDSKPHSLRHLLASNWLRSSQSLDQWGQRPHKLFRATAQLLSILPPVKLRSRLQTVRVTRFFKGNRSANRKLLNNQVVLERTELRTSQICEVHNDT
jgi:hypothetical protein